MSGNPDKASIWGDADVYISNDLTAPNPADENAPFGLAWDLVGLLDGEAGFEESRSRDSSDFFAWGQLLIRTSRRNFVLTRKFVCLEENAVTLGLVWPGSVTGQRRVPIANHRFKAAFETVDQGVGKVKRVITRRYAEVEEVDTIKDSESELTKLGITIKVYPDADGVLFDVQPDEGAATLSSISVTPANLGLDVGEFAPLTVTATYSDASTRDITNGVVFASSAPAISAVTRGFAEGVSVGAAVLTATYGGQSDTSAVTVTA